ncbi:MAG TPA: hypothetical protein VMX16_19765 [Terriglobia bacterium]|nr:hypothetical protein [Terriglobia bacterium]
MRALKITLPVLILAIAGTAFGQNSNSPAPANNVPAQDVIVPWRHFGSKPAPSSSPSSNGGQQRDLSAGSVPSSASMSVSSASAGTSQAASQGPDGQITEEDISKKHPHPPEELQLPPARDDASPLEKIGSGTSSIPSQAGSQSNTAALNGNGAASAGSQLANGNASPPDNSPESEVASLTSAYKKREADREAQRQELEKAAAKDPATLALAQIQETRLLLEGEQDRMQSTQQLSQAFSALADEIASRATQVRAMVENRKQMADISDADLDRMNDRTPRLDLSLRNIAMLPPSNENNQMIRRLDAELAQDDQARKLDEARSLQARHEMQSLEADSVELGKESAEARQKSAGFAMAAQDAKLNEGRLADRLEFSVTRQRATDTLNSTSKAIEDSVALTGNTAINSTVMGTSSVAVPTHQSVDRLRDCIRKTGDVEACRAKGDQ